MPNIAGRMLASKIAYSVRNSAGRIYPSLHVVNHDVFMAFSFHEHIPEVGKKIA